MCSITKAHWTSSLAVHHPTSTHPGTSVLTPPPRHGRKCPGGGQQDPRQFHRGADRLWRPASRHSGECPGHPRCGPEPVFALHEAIKKETAPPQVCAAALVLDFTCIPPFAAGNGRVSRLLAIAAVLEHGLAPPDSSRWKRSSKTAIPNNTRR